MSGLMKSRPGILAHRFVADQQGATSIEYAMIAAGVGATIAATIFSLGSALKESWYDKVAAGL
jgi:pilus assembly protein Flp/PilA